MNPELWKIKRADWLKAHPFVVNAVTAAAPTQPHSRSTLPEASAGGEWLATPQMAPAQVHHDRARQHARY